MATIDLGPEPTPVTVSKERVALVFPMQGGARAREARLRLRGLVSEFDENLLDPQHGSTVSPSPQSTEGADPNWSGTSLVVDFHGTRSVTGFTITATWSGGDADRTCWIQAWAGITWFEPTPASEYEVTIPSGASKTVEFPELEIQKLSLSFFDPSPSPGAEVDADAATSSGPSPVEITQIKLHCRRTASGLELRIGDEPPIWTHREPLSAEIATENLAEAINAWIDDQEVEPSDVPFSLSANGPGLVEVSAAPPEVYFVVEKFEGGAETVSFAFDCATPLSARAGLPLPASARVDLLRFDADWQFGPDRLFGSFPALGRVGVHASDERSLAQRLEAPSGSSLSGVDLRVYKDSDPVILTVGVSTAVRGRPARTAIGEATVTLEALESPKGGAEPTGAPAAEPFRTTWACARLEEPIQIEADEEYWIVLTVTEGSVVWFGRAVECETGVFSSTDGGGSWSAYDASEWAPRGTVHGDVRLWRRAELSPARILIGNSSPATLDSSSGTRTIVLENPKVKPPGLVVEAVAFGTVEITNLRIEYGTGADPAGADPSDNSGATGGAASPGAAGAPSPGPASLSAEGLETVHGIGPVYRSRLRKAGIETLLQLAASEPSAVPDVPAVRMVELAAKARTILEAGIDAETFEPLLATPLGMIADTPATTLVSSSGLSPEEIARLKNTLASLQVAMDDARFRTLTLSDVATRRGERPLASE